MKQTALFLVVIASFSQIICAEPQKQNLDRMLKASGGLITKSGTMTGAVSVLDCQDVASFEAIKDQADTLAKLMRINIITERRKIDIIDSNSFKCPAGSQACVFVINNTNSQHRIVHYPDDNTCIVNVAGLNRQNDSQKKVLNARTAKEVARALCFACGAGSSKHTESLMGSQKTVEDLDFMVEARYPMDVLSRMRTYLNSIGVTPEIKVPYIRACREGWAPAPTNEYQRAIWDKVHAMPTAPIKILPETKKVKE